MSTGLIIAIVVVVLILIALVAVLPRMRREAAEKKHQREVEQRRTEAADQHRTQATAQRHEAEAAEQRAQAQRAEADVAEKRAAANRAEAEAREAKADLTERGHADHEIGLSDEAPAGTYAEGRADRSRDRDGDDPLAARRAHNGQADVDGEGIPVDDRRGSVGRIHEPGGGVRERSLSEGDREIDDAGVQPKPGRDTGGSTAR